MTIHVVITQICNGCTKSRELRNTSETTLRGWREVENNTHICPECVEKIRNGALTPK